MTRSFNGLDEVIRMYGPHMSPGGWIFMIFGALFWLAFLVGIVVLIVWLVNQTRRPVAGETPMDILNRRYASGEITREEFERMKREISAK